MNGKLYLIPNSLGSDNIENFMNRLTVLDDNSDLVTVKEIINEL